MIFVVYHEDFLMDIYCADMEGLLVRITLDYMIINFS